MGLVALVLAALLCGSGVTRWLNLSLRAWDSTIDRLERGDARRKGR